MQKRQCFIYYLKNEIKRKKRSDVCVMWTKLFLDRFLGFLSGSQLRQISKAKPDIRHTDLEKLIDALITSRLDYCNSLYLGLQLSLIQHLQPVQNAAARLLSGTRRHDHITPVLANLHWLPVKSCIVLKILLYTYNFK